MKRSDLIICLSLVLGACGGDDAVSGSSSGSEDTATTDTETNGSAETDSDSMTGDGDGDPGDGDPGDGDPGDGDGDPGDGDGDPGDGDGDPGDGDGDPGDGDPGDGDPGDGDPGDGDGDPNACVDNSDCSEGNCVMGACEVVATCLDLISLDPNLPSAIYELDHDGMGGDDPYMAYCEMDTDGGGWTLVLKAEGGSQTFAYSSGEWTSSQPFGSDQADLDRIEAKLPSWQWVGFTQIMVGLEGPMQQGPLQLETVILDIQATSLFDLISPDAYVPTNVGRDAWLGLVNGSDMQPNCNREGFNVVGDQPQAWHRVRIGIIANEQNDCGTPDSRLGIGGAGIECGTLDDPTGNFAGCIPNAPVVNIPAFGVVFVR